MRQTYPWEIPFRILAILVPILGINLSAAFDPKAEKIKPVPLYYADVVAAAAGYDEVIVWEGLPGPFEKTRQAELAKPTHFQIGDQSFYNLPLPFTSAEQAAVTAAVLGTRADFLPWSGFKFCGGFHADYAIEWRRAGKMLAQALICFGCEEAQFRVGTRAEQVDLSPQGYSVLRAQLWHHHFGRPRTGDEKISRPPLPASSAPPPPPLLTPQPPPMPAAN